MESKIFPVSVVIPCYRCSETIERAVNSVYNQTWRPYEVILVDDHSEDTTLATLEKLRTKFGQDWVKVIPLNKNVGVATARNIGWDRSAITSEFIAFLDADDAWVPNKIELQYSWMSTQKNCTVTGHGAFMVSPDLPLPLSSYSPINDFTVSYICFNKLLISNPFVTPSFMVRRNIPIRFEPNARYAEDYFFLLRIGADGHEIAFLNCPLVWVFKQFGVSGISQNLLRMRLGDLSNYIKLWRLKKINFSKMSILILFSTLKYLVLITIGPQKHEALNRWLNNSHHRV